jgi:hypothetical protein
MAVPLGSAVSPKISKTAFLSLVYLLNAMVKQIWNLNMLDAQNERD